MTDETQQLEPGYDPFGPWDKLAQRINRLEQTTLGQSELMLETNKLMLDELKDIWKQMQHLHACLARVEVRLGIEPSPGTLLQPIQED